MDVDLAHVLRPNVDVFDLLGNDVFELSELEDVFPTVDDLQGSVLQR